MSRGKGQSLVRTAAYNARARLVDERTGEVWDYGRKGGLLAEAIYAPKDAPEWSRDLMRLVNEIERVEKRSDAQLAMNLDIALPHELTLEQNKRLMGDFVREEFSRQGYVAHFAIHAPDREGDERNIHAHVLVSLRKIGPEGFARTKAEQQDNFRNRGEHVEKLREKWERLGNRHLERAGHAPTLDRRSLQERGIDREPEQHKGPTVTEIERRGAVSQIAEEIRERQALDAERRALNAEARTVDAQIIDLQAERAMREAREDAKGRTDDVRTEIRPAAQEPAQQPEPVAEREQAATARDAGQELAATAEDAAATATKAARNVVGGVAKVIETGLGMLAGMFDTPIRLTPQEAHDRARAADEVAEAQAAAAPEQARRAAQDDLIAEQVRQRQTRAQEDYSRYGGVFDRPDEPEETRDRGRERER